MCNRTDCAGVFMGELACRVCEEGEYMGDKKEWPGCSSGGCIFGDPGGMHTNSTCNCLDDLTSKKRLAVNMLLARLRKENSKQQRIIDWLAQAAANNGWNGYRVSAEEMKKKAEEATKIDQP